MSTNCIKRPLSIVASLLMAFSVLPGSAAIFNFYPIEFQDATLPGDLPNDPALLPIEISLMLVESAGKIHFVILNTSDTADPAISDSHPAVTSIFIEDPGNLLGGGHTGFFDALGSLGTVAGQGVSYEDSQPGGTLQGKNNVSPSFTADFSFDPNSSPTQKGIDPAEQGSFEVGTASEAVVEAALASGAIRVGLHVQQIGEDGESSAGYLLDPLAIPEPGTLLLSLLGGGLLLVRRRDST